MDKHLRLPNEPTAAREARAAVQSALAEWDLRGCLDDALLVVSELATNAVRYGRDPIVLRLARYGATLRIAVQDGNADCGPSRRAPDQTEPCGRGLNLVAAVSLDWGWESDASSKTVWAEVGCRTAELDPG